MRIFVTGAYGLIGACVVARLRRDGHTITGFGRDIEAAKRRAPNVAWLRGDFAEMSAQSWRAALVGVEAVVNCAGALQDSPRDDLAAVHVDGVAALAEACTLAGVRRFVQISAVGIDDGATRFGAAKTGADEALRRSALDWIILRPGLVLAPNAYGGSALLRGLAAFPLWIPALDADAIVQIASVEDVTQAVARAVKTETPARVTVDLVARPETTIGEILMAMRAWLGLAPVPIFAVPVATGAIVAGFADALAWLGWRSPMRTTALAQLAAGVRGSAADGEGFLGRPMRDLGETLAAWPSGVQDRWFARLYFVKPLALFGLSIFWLLSGAIGFVRHDAAARVLTDAGFGEGVATAFVLAGSLTDMALGTFIAFRRTAPLALKLSIAVSFAYLVGATIWRPDLWGDPLGPLVKVFPAIMLALAALATMDER